MEFTMIIINDNNLERRKDYRDLYKSLNRLD